MLNRRFFCAMIIGVFSMMAFTTPAKADWWWDFDDRYGFDRCRCPGWRERILQDCSHVCEKYREACILYRARKEPCNCSAYAG